MNDTGSSLPPAGRRARLPLAPALAWLTAFFLLPLALTAAASFATRSAPLDWRFSLEGWREVFSPGVARVFWRTLGFAVATTLFCLVIGAPLAWFITRRGPRLRRLLYALVLLPLAANSLILAYAWMNLLRSGGVVGRVLNALGLLADGEQILYTGAASLTGMVYCYLPFMVYPVCASLDKIDRRLLEASADLGASGWQTLRHVVLPLAWPGVAAGCLLVFVQAAGTYIIPDLLGGSRELLAGTLIHMKFLGQAAHWPAGAAISFALMLMVAPALLVFHRLQSRGGGR